MTTTRRHTFTATFYAVLATVAVIATPAHTWPVIGAAVTHCAVVVAQAGVLVLGVAAVGVGVVGRAAR